MHIMSIAHNRALGIILHETAHELRSVNKMMNGLYR